MKKLLISLFLSLNAFSIGFANKSFTATISETGKDYKREYKLEYTPKKVVMTIISPEINKGEIYTYEDDKKYIYYPAFNQTVEQTLPNEDSDMINLIKQVQNVTKTSTIDGASYVVENNRLLSVSKNGYFAEFKYNTDNMPTYILLSGNGIKTEYVWKY